MKNLNGTKTHDNLKAAFAGESQANRRYLYFANKADVEGQNDVASVFRSTAEGETGHAHGHLDYLKKVGDPATDLPIGSTDENLKAAIADFKVIATDAKALVSTNRGNIATTLQNFRETSDHLLALSKEVRRAPWRLFATPDKKEVESLNLYDSARAFAQAATDIQTCADTLQIMIDASKEGVAVNPEILQGMQKRLEETFARYQEAEKALLKEFERIQK
jgi:rubrerythrin